MPESRIETYHVRVVFTAGRRNSRLKDVREGGMMILLTGQECSQLFLG